MARRPSQLAARRLSRIERRTAFLAEVGQMFDGLKEWYDQHPSASFGEIEAEARQRRRALMGQGLAVLINGRDTSYQIDSPPCPTCGKRMDFEDYRAKTVVGREGDTALSRAYYVCPRCEGQTLPPLDQTLRLRHDHWSEGTTRVAARQGLPARSFDQAAVAVSDAAGGRCPGTVSGGSPRSSPARSRANGHPTSRSPRLRPSGTKLPTSGGCPSSTRLRGRRTCRRMGDGSDSGGGVERGQAGGDLGGDGQRRGRVGSSRPRGSGGASIGTSRSVR